MVTAILDLHHGLAAVAALPGLSLGLLKEVPGLVDPRAFGLGVPPAAAGSADLGFAAATFALPAGALATHVLGFQRLGTPPRRANQAVSARVLHELFVPFPPEGGVKQHADQFRGDVMVAALRGHVALRIGERQLEAVPETGVAHAVEAFELRRLADRSIVVPAIHTYGSPRNPKQVREDDRQAPRGATLLHVARPGTDRSVGCPACAAGRPEGVAKSAKNVERFAEELGL